MKICCELLVFEKLNGSFLILWRKKKEKDFPTKYCINCSWKSI